MSVLKILASLAISSYLFYGAFSRLTHGTYTPERYAYQIDRSPDDGSTLAQIIPFMDIVLGLMALWPRTRHLGVALITIILGVGMYMRKLEGKDVQFDSLATLGAVGCWTVVGS